jgi:hypothetical protein
MSAVRRTFGLCAVGLIATIGSGCGTSSPHTDRAPDPRAIPASSNRQPPGWLTAGSVPLGPTTPVAAAPIPEPDFAQLQPISTVPQVEEIRVPANNSVSELVPPVQPVIVPSSSEPQWRPAGESRVP